MSKLTGTSAEAIAFWLNNSPRTMEGENVTSPAMAARVLAAVMMAERDSKLASVKKKENRGLSGIALGLFAALAAFTAGAFVIAIPFGFVLIGFDAVVFTVLLHYATKDVTKERKKLERERKAREQGMSL